MSAGHGVSSSWDYAGASAGGARMSEDDEAGGEATETGGGTPDAGLEDAARDEQEYLRRRLRDELGREPTQEELNEWLRRHTEGY